MMKKILVTGGARYIGSHTIVKLVKTGYTPIIVDNLYNTSIQNIKGIEKIIGTRRGGDIEQIYANGSLVKARLGQEAKETLEEAMKSAWDWEKQKQILSS